MGEVITAKDKEYEAEERATAPGANQSMSDRVNKRCARRSDVVCSGPREDRYRQWRRHVQGGVERHRSEEHRYGRKGNIVSVNIGHL